jgi:hypothetical protein
VADYGLRPLVGALQRLPIGGVSLHELEDTRLFPPRALLCNELRALCISMNYGIVDEEICREYLISLL